MYARYCTCIINVHDPTFIKTVLLSKNNTVPQLYTATHTILKYMWVFCSNIYKSDKKIYLLLSMQSVPLISSQITVVFTHSKRLFSSTRLIFGVKTILVSWWCALCRHLLNLATSVSQLGLKQHAERRFTSPGCSVPTLLDSTLCVWVTVFSD